MAEKEVYGKGEFQDCYEKTVDSVYRVCWIYFKGNTADVEDVVQTTYLKWLSYNGEFESDSHEKAWLLVTASNLCKNMLRHWWRKNVDIDEMTQVGIKDTYKSEGLIEYLNELPEKYRISLYLHYYEGYNAGEIAKMLHKTDSTVWGYLHKCRG